MQRRDLRNVDMKDKRVGIMTVKEKKEGSNSVWICECDCGNFVELCTSRLLSGTRKSCGCLERKAQKQFVENLTTHHESKTKMYKTWRGILDRCYNPNIKSYKYYGARGIKMCDEWKNSYEAFKRWSLENGYEKSKNRLQQSIDRIDVNGDYCPENCRWADSKIQSRNKNCVNLIMHNGEEITISEFCDINQITDKTFAYRWIKKGMTPEQVLKRWNEKENIPDYLIDCEEYAKQIGVTSAHVKRKIREGKLAGEQRGRKWYVIKI